MPRVPTSCSVASGSASTGTPGLQMGQPGSRSYLTVCVYRPVLPIYLVQGGGVKGVTAVHSDKGT